MFQPTLSRESPFKIRPVLLAILVLLIGETVLVFFLIRRGWFAGEGSHQVVILAVLLVVPLTIFLGCLRWSGPRFNIWQLLIAFSVLSVAFAWMAQPIWEFKSSRLGSRQLIQAGGHLTAPAQENKASAMQTGLWTNLLVQQWEKLPCDNTVTCIVLYNDQQVQLLIQHADRFPALRSLTLYQVSTESMQKLAVVLPKFNQLIDIWSQNVVFPAGWFRGLETLQSLSINWYPPAPIMAIQADDVKEIASFPDLFRFSAFGIQFDDESAKILGASAQIREIALRQTSVTKSGQHASEAAPQSPQESVQD